MRFRKTTIPPKGRNKYGNYLSGGNITKAVIRTVNYGDNTTGGGGTTTPTPETPKEPEETAIIMLSKTSSAFDGMEISITNVTEVIDVIGYKNLQRCDTLVGDIDNAYIGISDVPKGMSYKITRNGTTETKITFTITNNIEQMNGSIRIPCNVYRDSVTDFPLGADLTAWTTLKDKVSTMWLEWSYSISSSSASSSYTLDLTNENASINCDSDGNILAGAIRPTCQANLFYGKDRVEGAVFSISYSSIQNVKGVSIDTETGELTFGSNFSFDGTGLEIQVIASYAGSVVGRKIMTISKAYPGADGDGTAAVSRWVKSSASAIYYDVNTKKIVPETITLECWAQYGEDEPIKDNTTIYWGYDEEYPSNVYTEAINVVVEDNEYLAYGLKNSDNEFYEYETIPIVKSGKNGQDSSGEGRQGAAVRGPVNYYTQNFPRRWCNGRYNDNYPDDGKWLDVIKKDNKTYVCAESHDDTGTFDSTKWTQVTNEFDIVATDLILSDNAKFQFASTNAIYLMDGDTVTGGAQGGKQTSFWAGSDEPNEANFKVDYKGNLTAKSGTFAGYIQMPYVKTSTLMVGNSCYPEDKAYLLVDSGFYGMGDGCEIKIPEPSAALNGFTYHIIAAPNLATKGVESSYTPGREKYFHSVTLQTINGSKKLSQNVFIEDGFASYTTLGFFSGNIIITCIPSFYNDNYVWCVTQCEDIDCYEGYELKNTYLR